MYEVKIHPHKTYNDWTEKPELKKYYKDFINSYLYLRTYGLLTQRAWDVRSYHSDIFYGRSG